MKEYTPEQRIRIFWSRVDKSGGEDACWLWTGCKSKKGYGRFYWDERMQKAHRVSYFLAFGKWDDGLMVLHKCDNPACVNPKHLFLGTNQDNVEDRGRKNRTAKGEANGAAKLTSVQVIEIRRLYKEGDLSRLELSRVYEVGDSTINSIVNRKTWKWLNP